MQITYLNRGDKSDPSNRLRVLCFMLARRYVKFTWDTKTINLYVHGGIKTPNKITNPKLLLSFGRAQYKKLMDIIASQPNTGKIIFSDKDE